MEEKLFPLKLYLKHRINLVLFVLAIIINLVSFCWLAYYIRPQEEQIFLHYNALFGVDLIGSWYKIYYLPVSGLLIIIVNTILGWILYRKSKSIGYIAGGISVFLQIIIFIASYLLVLLNV